MNQEPDNLVARALKILKGDHRESSDEVLIEPAHPQGRPVYFERNDGVIYGPARVTDLTKVGTGTTERFWVIVEFQGQPAWVRSDRLRPRKAFEQQPEVRAVKPIPKDGF